MPHFPEKLPGSEKKKKKILLIEDGGYLAPLLNEIGRKEMSLKKIFREYKVESPYKNDLNFYAWLRPILIGTVEHTKNGYDRLKAIQKRHKQLLFPSFSIAVSDLKTKEEAREVAHSILSAIESILHENGLVLSHRNIMVLGAAGNIGKHLCKFLEEGRLRIDENRKITRVDLQFKKSIDHCYRHIQDIPESEYLNRDMFIGVIGHSIMKGKYIENLIINGNKPKL